MANKKILLSLTTITEGEWRNKVKEIDELGLKEIALFPTCLNDRERRELYSLLEKTKLERIPHVHLRDGMTPEELDYLIDKFGTEVFNLHSEKCLFASKFFYQKHAGKIYVENTREGTPTENDLKKYAGWCCDLSHWQSFVLSEGESGQENVRLTNFAKKYKIGIMHISAIKKELRRFHDRRINKDFYGYDSHHLKDLSELDYATKYKKHLPDIISIELENPLKRQLEVKEYLEKILAI